MNSEKRGLLTYVVIGEQINVSDTSGSRCSTGGLGHHHICRVKMRQYPLSLGTAMGVRGLGPFLYRN